MKFEDFDIDETLLESISYMGFNDATPVQEKTIPSILEGKDLITCAQTGTGKTAAFMIPILHSLMKSQGEGIKALVLVPTRELAIQIDQVIQGFAYFMPVESLAVYGGGSGEDWGAQKNAIVRGSDIIVATPGKLISHLNMGYVDFSKLEYLVLDEADRMLDIGFLDDILKIVSHLPKKRQTLMFSATMPSNIKYLAKEVLTNPMEVTISLSKPAEGVLQAAYLIYENDKVALTCSLIADKPEYKSILIFGSTKKKVSEVYRALKKKNMNVQEISSDLQQSEREEVLLDFRSRKTRVLVATDVLSRGIDIKDINLIINFDVPNDAEDYVHRIGRTARAETTGVALTFVNEDDMYKLAKIEKLIDKKVPKVPLPDEIKKGPEWNPKQIYRPRSGRVGGGGNRRPHNNRRK